MCLPAAILIPVALAAATTAVSVVGQVQAANAANAGIKEAYANKQVQINEQAAAQINARLREMRRDESRIQTAAGASGLSLQSGSILALQSDAEMQAGLANENSLANRESASIAARDEANNAMVAKPTLLGAGLQIGLSGLNAAVGAGAFKGANSAGAVSSGDAAFSFGSSGGYDAENANLVGGL
jgi:hypothetical protein